MAADCACTSALAWIFSWVSRTSPFLMWSPSLTMIATIAPKTTTAPTPIPTFCHVFMGSSLAVRGGAPAQDTRLLPLVQYLIYALTSQNVSLWDRKAFLVWPLALHQGPFPPSRPADSLRGSSAESRLCALYFRYK